MKKYGIYLAYPPTVDMRIEGLGRHLAEFLKGAQERGDTQFVIACPSWMRRSLVALFETSGIQSENLEIISPKREPLLLRLHQWFAAFRKYRKHGGRLRRITRALKNIKTSSTTYVEKRLVGSRNIIFFILFFLLAIPILIAGGLAGVAGTVILLFRILFKRARRSLAHHPVLRERMIRIHFLLNEPKHDSLASRLYRLMEDVEASLMRNLIKERKDIAAWYSPTAFWPHFNGISAPRLICVPDVVLTDFPVGFAAVGGNRFLDNFKLLEKAIEGGEYFVTYSEDVKWRTLVDRYHADPDLVSVVPHGANRLDKLVFVSGFPDNETAATTWCRHMFKEALRKAAINTYAGIGLRGEVKFLFYASQFRPNKNIISLLKAYEYLLRRRYIGHKLVLTGHPHLLPEVNTFIEEHNLQSDVLCLYGLSERELAACYRLADLAVNPSLSEGGCPFTFTEALSVGTPVVMARIPVSEEVITDPELQELMFFDPYDWKNMAERIEWGLNNRARLLEKQKPFYEQLARRTWRNVVDEYIEILDRISSKQTVGDDHVA